MLSRSTGYCISSLSSRYACSLEQTSCLVNIYISFLLHLEPQLQISLFTWTNQLFGRYIHFLLAASLRGCGCWLHFGRGRVYKMANTVVHLNLAISESPLWVWIISCKRWWCLKLVGFLVDLIRSWFVGRGLLRLPCHRFEKWCFHLLLTIRLMRWRCCNMISQPSAALCCCILSSSSFKPVLFRQQGNLS